MEPIRVLHVLDALNQGGIENLIMNVFRAIDRNIIQFDFALRRESKRYFDKEIEGLGGRIFYFDNDGKSVRNYRNSLNRIINENGPYKAIHSHCYFFSGYILKIAWDNNVPIRIAHSHDTKKGRKDSFKRKIYEGIMRNMIREYSTDMISCSDEAGKYVFGKNAGYTVVYNGIDINRFKFDLSVRESFRKKLNIENAFVLIHVGRFADQKNHLFILDILKDLSKSVDNWKMIFIGDGELLNQIKEKASSLEIADSILYLSGVANPEYYYNASDIFVLPSKYEGLGIVAVEAQVNGLPSVISEEITREVGITDLVQYISISEGTLKWVEVIKEIKEGGVVDRNIYPKQISETPFDIKKTAEVLQEIYLRDN